MDEGYIEDGSCWVKIETEPPLVVTVPLSGAYVGNPTEAKIIFNLTRTDCEVCLGPLTLKKSDVLTISEAILNYIRR